MKSTFFKRVTSYFMILVYASTVLFSSQGQASGFYRPLMKQAADAFNEVAAIAKKTGDADVFQRVFGFSQVNAEFFKKHLGTNAPSVKVDKSEFIVSVEGSDPVKVKIVNLEKGDFLVNGLAFKFDPNESAEKAAERMLPLAQAKGFGIHSLWNLIVPSSHALDKEIVKTIVIAVAAVVAVGLLVWAWNKSSERKAETERLGMANSHEQSMANIALERNKVNNKHQLDMRTLEYQHGRGSSGASDNVIAD
jgi:hypothetical protein